MKTLKKLIVPAVCLASFMAGSSYADGLMLGAPGVDVGSVVATTVKFDVTKDLGRFYKYTVRGIESKGAYGGNTGNSGKGDQGHLNLFATVNGETTKSVGNSWKGNGDDFNTSSVRTIQVTPIVYDEIMHLMVNWTGVGSLKSPQGYFVILGEGIREPKEPKGTLGVQSYALEGDKFKVKWDVLRDY